eukprot:1659917-Heterocapsa_arctica.AAC.1
MSLSASSMASPPVFHLASMLAGSRSMAYSAGLGSMPVVCVNMALWSARSNSSMRLGDAYSQRRPFLAQP